MPPTGVHSLIAAVVSDRLVPSKQRTDIAWGVLLGSVLPDVDILPMAIAYLITGNSSVIYLVHRSGTHSVAAIILTYVVCHVMSAWRGQPRIRRLGLGLSLGIALHILADMLWWGPVDLLWPLGFLGVPSEVYLLKAHPLSPLAAKLLGAGEFAAYAAYFGYLVHKATRKQMMIELLPRLRRIIYLQAAAFIAFALLALVLTRAQFEIVLYVFLIFVFFPLFLYVIVKARSTIGA